MKLSIPADIYLSAHPQTDDDERAFRRMHGDEGYLINADKEGIDGMRQYLESATARADKKTVRVLERVIAAMEGNDDTPVPSFEAFHAAVTTYLRTNNSDGLIYVRKDDGLMYPELVTFIGYHQPDRNNAARVTIHTAYIGIDSESNKHPLRPQTSRHAFYAADVARLRPSAALEKRRLYRATPKLNAAHAASLERFDKLLRDSFGKTLTLHGQSLQANESRGYYRRELPDGSIQARKVIHDIAAHELPNRDAAADSILSEDGDGQLPLPVHPVLRVFDLKSHEFYWAHSDYLQVYQYDHSLGDKLVLPASHRDLLNILTTDLDAFIGDVIEGKSAGNIILCKGMPGVGKTLTAEVYSELIDKPLYSVHAGNLGTSAESIANELRIIFDRVTRWNCVLLLDEADVFVAQRGDNIEQNAIVAEFLRTMEYFGGLMFMTTNRPDSIDDAILSRCAAVIGYEPPNPDDAARIWRVMATNFRADQRLSESVLKELVAAFAGITARDIKMLLRLALRVSTAHKEPLTLDLFRRCAMFRALPSNLKAELATVQSHS